MITVAQARELRYGQTIYVKGSYDSTGRVSRCRVNGKVQLWKTRPNDFRIPVRRGLYERGYITPSNADQFTLKEPAPKKFARKKLVKAVLR